MAADISFHSPFEESGHLKRSTPPCVLIIFGATGDLTARKLMPAIYNLKREGQLPPQFSCVGFARRDKSNDVFRQDMKEAINKFSRVKPIDESLWSSFSEQISYHRSEFDQDEGYRSLKIKLEEIDKHFGTQGNRVFYLSTQPSFFTTIVEKLHKNGLINNESNNPFTRVIIEKPFGHNTDSAYELQGDLLKYLKEEQIYRIDHYLGKETVQNLLVFRFSNVLFESLWNNRYIDHVQITVAENIGIGTRGRFYEESGLLRDIVQNHMMQLLSLVAMEPPVSLDANAVRDEKVKVLEAIKPYTEETILSNTVRGQYGEGFVDGEKVKSYRDEDNVDQLSNVETYAALKLFINNWRWDGVPFYLRGGKRMPKRATEIAVHFKQPPGSLFKNTSSSVPSNVLVIRIQPNEGSALKINCKIPGPSSPIHPVTMDFSYGSFFGQAPPEAYERLICDCMTGDSTLFAREDEVFNSWRILTPLIDYWHENKQDDFANYTSGSWGPKAADVLMANDHRSWRII